VLFCKKQKLPPPPPDWQLHIFGLTRRDGSYDNAGLAVDAAGNLYGVTQCGGTGGAGTVYKLAPDGTKTVLYGFSGTDGAYPNGGLLIDASGALYVATQNGGGPNNFGTVFKITP
jgi:uncharacterized repeat protein (TIGR03803 family)